MRWFFNDGGPLLILPQTSEVSWQGSVADEQDLEPTDYDRACEAIDVSSIPVDSGWAVVIPTGTKWAGWLGGLGSNVYYLAAIVAADDDDPTRLVETVSRESTNWRTVRLGVRVEEGVLLLLHAASAPEDLKWRKSDEPGESFLGEGIMHPVASGSYVVSETFVENEWLEARFLRFANC